MEKNETLEKTVNEKTEIKKRRMPRRKTNSPKFEFKKENLKIIPLGGLNEIGKNITVFEYGDEIVVVDCGLEFPEDDMLGVDLVIPDITYLEKNKEKIKGIVYHIKMHRREGVSDAERRLFIAGSRCRAGTIRTRLRTYLFGAFAQPSLDNTVYCLHSARTKSSENLSP